MSAHEDKNASDLRQLGIMLSAIDAFLVDTIGLGDLVATLSFLLTHLEDVSDNWRDGIQDRWALLEMIYAEAREEKRKLTEAERQYVLDNLSPLKELVQRLILELKQQSG